ncbi:MAG: alpha/beta hydrolase, partial [Chloroflexi bacterium]|nr:alpha/beta hydrolase [Chloroflexota bacterium]
AQLPHAVTEHIPLSGHMLLEEQPAIVNAAIRRFLDGVRVEDVATKAQLARLSQSQRQS